jgi:hypothetical protein
MRALARFDRREVDAGDSGRKWKSPCVASTNDGVPTTTSGRCGSEAISLLMM